MSVTLAFEDAMDPVMEIELLDMLRGAVNVAPEARMAPLTLRSALLMATFPPVSEKVRDCWLEVATMLKSPFRLVMLPLLAILTDMRYASLHFALDDPMSKRSSTSGIRLIPNEPPAKSPVSLLVGISGRRLTLIIPYRKSDALALRARS